MVNRVDGNQYYDYAKSDYAKSKKADIPENGQKFSLGYQKDELQTEVKDQKEKEVSEQEKQQAAEYSGVRIELSDRGVEKQRQAQGKERPDAPVLAALLERIRTFVTAAVAAIGDVFSKIWNTPQEEASLKDSEESTETADVIKVTAIAETEDFPEDTAVSPADEAGRDREIRKHLQNGEIDQVIRLLTDDGRRTAARNSTLLTCYDRNGRVVKPDASIQQRALYGDRNVRKL